ncbi:coniferyl aldehyde dehydrogenase [Acinetobacter sp. MD2(2019)]|uniref:coniferyl aldehyde dehydrogenase n=1 Tax=Acinetobacter sp. MD2(2019) TaxID=2605273 RepID=UPI002D1E7DBB|nr:coniferyl aldehyde dehydrogenase [Acinetobacter sp. MD2(2019)]MEB3752800.1 coniferyl aldehyde dehydrogenase [Acinetobacter sp. MD2(2019)]
MDQSTFSNQTQDANLEYYFQQQKQAYLKQPNPTLAERKQWLKRLKTQLLKQQKQIANSIKQDFGNRSKDETRLMELLPSIMGINYALKNLKEWMQPSKRHVSLLFQPAQAYVMYQPVGVVGIVVPWNYPLFLAIGPLCQALAAGNRVMLKMSEFTPTFSALFKQLIAEIFPENLVHVVVGDATVAQEFTTLRFNHLLFTGATAIGKHVMQAAAQNLTPVTLELGGKSPVIIGQNADLTASVQRIAFGKSINSGQTCVAPDYVFVPETQLARFIEHYQKAVHQFYPEITQNPDYTSIINDRQYARLRRYLDDAIEKGATVVPLYNTEKTQHRSLSHFLVYGVDASMLLMQEEIFGPILPIIGYNNINEAIDYINHRERPLALYYFGNNTQEQQHVLTHTHSGGVCLNETLVHVGQDDLPFGGVGASGLGSYHGYEGFLTFSHAKSVFVRPQLSFMKFIYPPYGTKFQKMIYKWFLR